MADDVKFYTVELTTGELVQVVTQSDTVPVVELTNDFSAKVVKFVDADGNIYEIT